MSTMRIRFWTATATVLFYLAVEFSVSFATDSPVVTLWVRVGTYVVLLSLGIIGSRNEKFRQKGIGMLIGCGALLIPIFMLIFNIVFTGSVM